MKLTPKQTKILTLLSDGKGQKEIAAAMVPEISVRTVEGYLMRLRSKFGAKNLTQLVVFFTQMRRPGNPGQ